MRVMTCSKRLAARLVPREESTNLTIPFAGESHQRSAQIPNECGPVRRVQVALAPQIEGDDIGLSIDWLHQAQSAEAPVTYRQRSGHGLRKLQLHMPQNVFREPGTLGEVLRSRASTNERLLLNANT